MRKFLDYHKDAFQLVKKNLKGAFSSAGALAVAPAIVSSIPGINLLRPFVPMLLWPFGDASMTPYVDVARGKETNFLKTTLKDGTGRYFSFIFIELIIRFLTFIVNLALCLIPIVRWFGFTCKVMQPQWLVFPRYLMHDHPELGVGDAIKISRKILKRHSWLLSFLGWSITIIMWVLFVPLIWVLSLLCLVPIFTPVLLPIVVVLQVLRRFCTTIYNGSVMALYYDDLKAEVDADPEARAEIEAAIKAITAKA
jgi:hypothetical protein